MIRRPATGGLLGAVLVSALALDVLAVGFGFGLDVTTIDVTETFANVPIAAGDAFDALDQAFADLGVPAPDRVAIRDSLDQGLAGVEEALIHIPTTLPVPLVGGCLEIPLPLLLIDGLRLSGGYVSDGVLRDLGEVIGFTIPTPLVDVAFDENGLSGSIQADLAFRSWHLATEAVKRFDVLVAALDLALGVHLTGGEATPAVLIDVPPEMADGVADALAALHLDGFTWSAFCLHGRMGLEIGPPFLRLRLGAYVGLPISTSSGWWSIGTGGLGGTIELVIRF